MKKFFFFFFPLCVSAQASDEGLNQYASLLKQDAPDEFLFLLTPGLKSVQFIFPDGKDIILSAELEFSSVKLSDAREKEKIKIFLQESGFTSSGINSLVKALTTGIKNYNDCKGEKIKCKINNVTEPTAVIDTATLTVRIYVPETYYQIHSDEINYADVRNPNPALISSQNIHLSFNENTKESINVSNKNILGLPYGFIKSQLYAAKNQSNAAFNLSEFVYNIDYHKYNLLLGRSNNFTNSNSTSILSFYSKIKDGVYVSTTNNLATKSAREYQRLYYYMPESGEVEVYRDKNLVFSSESNSGQNYISYSSLPYGNYDVRLVKKVNGQEISSDIVYIINNDNMLLGINGADVNIGFARLNEDAGRPIDIFEASTTYRPFNSLIIGAGVETTGQEYFLKGAIKSLPFEKVSGVLNGGIFNNRSLFISSSLTYNRMTLSYTKFTTKNDENVVLVKKRKSSCEEYQAECFLVKDNERTLSSQLLGSNNTEQIMLSSSFPFLWGNAYINAMSSKNESSNFKFNNLSYNVGFSFSSLLNSTVGINAGFNSNSSVNTYDFQRRSNKINNATVALNISVPLDNNVRMTIASSKFNKDVTGSVGLDKTIHNDEKLSSYLSSRQMISNGNKTDTYILGGGMYKNPYFNASNNLGYSTKHGVSGYVNTNSTQILTKSGLYFTNHASDAYLIVEDNSNSDIYKENVLKTHVTIHDDKKVITNSTTNVNKPLVLPLEKYATRRAKVNNSSNGYFNKNDSSITGFTLPGSVLYLLSEYDKEYQILAAFYNVKGDALNDLICVGSSCGRIEKLEDGLYKFYLKGRNDFEIMSNSKSCLNSFDITLKGTLSKFERVVCLDKKVDAELQIARSETDELDFKSLKSERQETIPLVSK